jgi:hypothetical protein
MVIFTCIECKKEISSNVSTPPRDNTCLLCSWIRDNLHLTEQERIELREKFRKQHQ